MANEQPLTERQKSIFVQLKLILYRELGRVAGPDRVTLESRLRTDFAVDSLDSIDLVLTIEDVFDICIHDEDIAKIENAGDVTVREIMEWLDRQPSVIPGGIVPGLLPEED